MNSLISSSYKALNATQHNARADYGQGGARWGGYAIKLAREFDASTMLDYGAGKCALAHSLAEIDDPKLAVTNYDPAIKEIAAEPEPAEIVFCTDVLEHVEPEYLDNVIAHVASKTQKAAVFAIHLIPAQKSMPDGRNAHLIQESFEFWLAKLGEVFKVRRSCDADIEGVFLCLP